MLSFIYGNEFLVPPSLYQNVFLWGVDITISHRHSHSNQWSWAILKPPSGAMYCQTSNIGCTKSPNLNVSRLVLQLSLPNPLKPGVKSGMKV